MSAFLSLPGKRTICLDIKIARSVADLKRYVESSKNIRNGDYFITTRGQIADDENDLLTSNAIYQVCPRLLGGKGGFGSMLRAIGAQIEKTTNREACRDLSGRRMRDVNNEKQLKEWLGKKADREKEKERRRLERLARRLAIPKHHFEDQQYESQKSRVAENLEDALHKGLLKSLSEGKGKKKATSATVKSESSRKRKAEESSDVGPSTSKRSMEWMGVDAADFSDLDSDLSDSDDSETSSASDSRGLEDEKLQTGNDTDNHDNSNQALGLKGILVEAENNGSATIENIQSENCDGDQEMSHSCGLLSMLPSPVNTDQSKGSSQLDQGERNKAAHSMGGEELKDINWEECSSVEEICQIGLEKLKTILTEKGLKCGGTLEQRAQRLFSVKGLTPDQINPALRAKPQNGISGKNK